MKNRIQSLKERFTRSSPLVYRRVRADIRRRPLFNFLIALLILFLILLANSVLTKPKDTQTKAEIIKPVKIYSIGTSPTVTLQGKVEKSNVIKILSQAGGIVKSINFTEGDNVSQGQTLLNLASNYQGDNAPSLQAAIANASYKNTLDSYPTQKDLLNKQREVAASTADNTEAQRKLTIESRDMTQRLIDDNQKSLNNVNQLINGLQSNPNPEQDKLASAMQLRSQLSAGLAQLQTSVNQMNYATESKNPPTKLADLQKEMTLKQIDVQEKALNLGKEVAGLQASLAAVGASVMTPATPVSGKVERIHVTVGQSVTPGTLLATVSGNEEDPTIIVNLPREMANEVSRTQASTLHLGDNKIYQTVPRHVSSEAVDGTQNVALFFLPPEYAAHVTADSYIPIDIPLGLPSTNATIPFVPLDSIYQSSDEAYVYVAKNGKAEAKKVTLGEVYGDYTEVTSGLTSGDQIILNRNIIAGDKIKIEQ